MFFVICGKDTFRSRRKMNELLDFFRSKDGGLGIFRTEGETFKREEFEELMRSRALFGEKFVVAAERLMENAESQKFVLQNLDGLKKSKNIFLFWEEEMDSEHFDLLREQAEKIQKFEMLSAARVKKWMEEEAKIKGIAISSSGIENISEICGSDLWCAQKETEKFVLGSGKCPALAASGIKYNPFAICDAVSARDGRKAWLLLQEAGMAGVPTEEVFWKLWWQAKNLLLISQLLKSKTKNLEKESGLHPFVVKKTLAALKNFTERELKNFSWRLAELYRNSKIGLIEINIGLEKLIVNL